MSRHKLSRDQKRRKKLANRARPAAIQPYEGNKYRNDRWVRVILEAEIGILESYKIADERLTDKEVRASLEYFIRQLRRGHPEPPTGNPQQHVAEGQVEDLVACRIKDRWYHLFQQEPRPAPDDLAGCLRTIMSSLQTWSRPNPESRGYLHYLEGFLAKLGVRIEVKQGDAAPDGEEESDEPTDIDVLLDLGQEWIETHDSGARRKFLDEADVLLEEGQAGVVIEACQHLMGRLSHQPVLHQEFQDVIKKAWQIEPP